MEEMQFERFVRGLVEKGKKHGVLTYGEIIGSLQGAELSPDQIDDIYDRLTTMGIDIVAESQELESGENPPETSHVGIVNANKSSNNNIQNGLRVAGHYKYFNPFDVLRTTKSILQQTNSWKAWILLIIAILWSMVLNLSPIMMGIYAALQAHSFWPAIWVPIIIYVIYGLFLAFWPVLALFSFIGAWYKEGFLEALLGTVFGMALLFVLFNGPEWLIFLAFRYAEKAARFSETR